MSVNCNRCVSFYYVVPFTGTFCLCVLIVILGIDPSSVNNNILKIELGLQCNKHCTANLCAIICIVVRVYLSSVFSCVCVFVWWMQTPYNQPLHFYQINKCENTGQTLEHTAVPLTRNSHFSSGWELKIEMFSFISLLFSSLFSGFLVKAPWIQLDDQLVSHSIWPEI